MEMVTMVSEVTTTTRKSRDPTRMRTLLRRPTPDVPLLRSKSRRL